MATERLDIVISERGARRVSRNIAKIGTASRAAQGGVSLLRSALGALGGALILRGAIRTLADFSQSMSTIKAITGEVGRGFDALRNRAKELGIQTRFSATQAAEGMVFLARTGFDANEVLQTIQGTLNLAQVGLIDVARAADIASNVLKGFRLEASQMSRIIDILAKTSSRSNTNVEQLGDAMSFAAPAAAALGISAETTAAAIGVLSDAGIQASRAGSGLRTAFIKLLAGQGAAKKSLKAVSLSLSDVNIEARGLIPVLQTLRDANIGLTQSAELVGIRQANNLLILIDSLPRLKQLQAENLAAANSAKVMADVMDDNLNGALIRVKSAFEGVVIALGDEGGTSGLRSLFENTATILRIVASNADVLAKALTILGTVILGRLVIGAIGLLIGQLKKLGLAIVALSARLIPAFAAAAIAAFAVLGAVAVAEGEDIQDTFDRLRTTVTDFFKDIVIPTDAIEGFKEEIIKISGALAEASRGGRLAKDEINKFIDTIEELKSRVSDQLLITEFLAPGSKAVLELTVQVETLEASLKRLRDIQAGKGLVVPVGPGRDPNALPPKLFSFKLDLEAEAKLLKVTNREREIRQVLLDAESAAGVGPGGLNPVHEQLIEALARENQALRDQREVIEDILAPATEYNVIIDALSGSLAKAELSERQRTDAARDARIEFLNQQTDLVSGTERAFLKMGRDSDDLATQIEGTITNAFRGAEDALHDFVTTGKLDFASLIDSIISDLARLAIKGAIINPIANALGLGGTGIGDEDPTKGLQGLFSKIFGGGDTITGPGPLPDEGGLAESIGGLFDGIFGTNVVGDGTIDKGTAAGFEIDPSIAAMAEAANAATAALTSAAPAIEQVTTAALPAAQALGTDLAQSTIDAAIGTATETLASETLVASLGQLALVSDAAAAALQRVAASGGLGADGGPGGLQGVFDSIFSSGGSGPGPLPDPSGFAEFIPGFKHGGQVEGNPGEVPIMAHAGEVILNKTQQQALLEAFQTGKDPSSLINPSKFGLFGSLITSVAGFNGGGGNSVFGKNALSGPIALGPDTALNPNFSPSGQSPFEVFGAAAAAGGFGGLLRSLVNFARPALQGEQPGSASFAHGGVVGPSSASFLPPTSVGNRKQAGSDDGGEAQQIIMQTWNIETQDVGGFNRSRHQIMGQAAGGAASVRGRG